MARFPNGPQWSAAQQAIVDAEYQIGVDALNDQRYDDARTAWTAFLQRYPLDRRAPMILTQFGDMAFTEQVQREQQGKVPNWTEPIAHWRRLVNKYPETEHAGAAQFRIAETLETKAQDLEAAIGEYRKLTWSSWADRAREREAEMQATRLNILTERVLRTDEPARIRVDTRNIEILTVKLYRLDTEDYFRKSHSLRGVERLDLLLIDPDETIEVPVRDYARYKPITQEVEIPFEGPGVFAINVSNEKSGVKRRSDEATKRPRNGDGPKLEATTLLIRSDIDIIVKTSRRAVLVFAQNMRTNEPAGGVNVLVSDGKQVVLSGKTGDDGVWLTKSIDMKHRPHISVFAERGGHVAGNALSLGGLGFSTGLQPRGYIYTDRPAYRPGDAVNIRGILREVKDGQYVLPTQPDDERLRWKLDVVDPKGRVLTTEPIRFTEFGSCATQFRVAADAPVGQYKLIAHRPDGPTFTGTFRVEIYQLAKAYLDFDERVVMRGEKISGSIVAKYHYGEAVVGKPIEYAIKLPTGEEIRRSGVTDGSGKVAFEFDSSPLPEEGRVWFEARQAELGIAATAHVWVAVRAFRAAVSTPRPLYLSEEPVEVTVTTKDLKGEPIAQEMTLTALLRTYHYAPRSAPGSARRGAPRNAGPPSPAQQAVRPIVTWAETKVETAAVKTEEKTGRGRATLKLTKGGTYVLRVEGKDRFDHVITAETIVRISDEDDKTHVRIFSDRQHYKVGEKIALDIHSRLERGGDEATLRRDSGRVPRPSDGEGGQSSALPARHEVNVAAGPRTGRDVAAGASPAERSGPRLRAAAYLALITYEGEEVIGYRTLKLRQGHNRFELPVEHAHFPNFAVGVAVMAHNKFHTASREFTVERQLSIALTPDKDVYRPRDEMELEIKVTDQQGNPVSAEVGLAMIDNALLTKYPDQTPDIVAFFQEGARRHAAMRTQTSCTFRYQAQTWVMATELLAEAERLEEERGRYAARREPAPARFANAPQLDLAGSPESRSYAFPGRAGEKLGELVEQLRSLGYSPDQIQAVADATFESQAGTHRIMYQYIFGGQGSGGRGRGGGRQQLGVEFEPQTEGWDVAYDISAVLAEDIAAGRERYYGHGVDRIQAGREVQRQVDDAITRIIALTDLTSVEAERLIGDLVRKAPPRSYFPKLAYWNPRITTDENGQATVRIVLPDTNTKWKLIARAVSGNDRRDADATLRGGDDRRDADATMGSSNHRRDADATLRGGDDRRDAEATLVGAGDAEVISKTDFFVELLTPPILVEADKVRPAARVHCLTAYEGEIEVMLRAKGSRDQGIEGSREGGQTRTLKASGSGVYDVEFDEIEIRDAGEMVFEVSAETREQVDEAIIPAVREGLTQGVEQLRIQAGAQGINPTYVVNFEGKWVVAVEGRASVGVDGVGGQLQVTSVSSEETESSPHAQDQEGP